MPPEILVIREKDRFSSILIEQGFSVINFPVIKTAPLADLSELENCLAEMESFDGIFITSIQAAEIVLAKLKEMRKTFRSKFFILGKRSNDLLKNAGCKTFFSEQATTAEELLNLIPKEELKNKRFLFPRGNRSLRVIPETLQNIAEVVEVIIYRTIEAEAQEEKLVEVKEKLERGKIAVVCFFSPSGVKDFLEKFENFTQGEIEIAAIGRTTARCAEENNLRVNFISAKPSASDFASELIRFLRKEI